MAIDDDNDFVELAILCVKLAILRVELAVVPGDGARHLGEQLVDGRDIDPVAFTHRVGVSLLPNDHDRLG